MRQIADFHIHSRYSRACSRALELANIDKTCRAKGVDIIGTGDFTHPKWFSSIKDELEEISFLPLPKGEIKRGSTGLYKLKSAKDENIKFVLTVELALIFKSGGKVRRIHVVVHAPNLDAAKRMNDFLGKKYNIRSDGRPILGISAVDLCKICFSIHPDFLIYPAHIWTPWFSVFGSKSGFNSMEECFGEFTEKICAYESGLSSDPEMNWRVSVLDDFTLLSNSDAHSLANIAREANVFDLERTTFSSIAEAIKNSSPAASSFGAASGKGKLEYTIEFHPEEGMYHLDGHRDCGVSFSPEETVRRRGICPACKKPLVIGVLNRAGELADRERGFKPAGVPGFKKLVELDKIIAESLGIKSRSSKKVQEEYKKMISVFGNELKILIDEPLATLNERAFSAVAEGIKKARAGDLSITPGFDGRYGMVKIFSEKKKQKNLF